MFLMIYNIETESVHYGYGNTVCLLIMKSMVKFSPSIITNRFPRICFRSSRIYSTHRGKKIEMTTFFKTTLRKILIFNQFSGLIDISYTSPPTALLFYDTHSTIYSLLERVRTCFVIDVHLRPTYFVDGNYLLLWK